MAKHNETVRRWGLGVCRRVTPTLLLLLILVTAATAQSLDDELLKDLETGRPPAPPKADVEPPRGKPDSAKGEDIELQSTNPLSRIAGWMRTVEERIGTQRDTAQQTQRLQKQIVTDLDSLIRQVEQQNQSNQSQRQQGTGAGNDADGAGQPGNRPARESTERVGQGAASQADLEQFEQLIREVWGHLPPQLRKQMLQGAVDKFLPQYERMIEEYYQRLAEEPR